MAEKTLKPMGRGEELHPVTSLGLDIGWTTAKAVVLDGATLLFSAPSPAQRRCARGAAAACRRDRRPLPGARFQCAVTGSAGLSVAELMRVEFIQEVIAALGPLIAWLAGNVACQQGNGANA